MRLLAIDFGTKKCGIAISDPLKIIAQPLTIIFYENGNYSYLINRINSIIKEYSPIETIIIGITKNINKDLSIIGKKIIKFKELLKKELIYNIEIILFDEKYTTKKAKEIMTNLNITNERKKLLKDALAAQKILEEYLNTIN